MLCRSARDLRCFSARKLLRVDSAREMGYFLCSEMLFVGILGGEFFFFWHCFFLKITSL